MSYHVSHNNKQGSLSAHYRNRLDQADEYLTKGNNELARDVCLELRLKSDIGVFSRARLNLILATIYKHGVHADTYAYECLDLLDILRQDEGGVSAEDDQVMSQMEDAAKDVIDQSEIMRQAVDKKPVPDEKVKDEQVEDSGLNSPAKMERDEPEEETWTLRLKSKDRTEDELQEMKENREKYELKVEGFLRRGGKYKPLERYIPLSRRAIEPSS